MVDDEREESDEEVSPEVELIKDEYDENDQDYEQDKFIEQ